MIKNSGFTFTELLVVLAAIALVSILSIPVLYEIHARTKFYLALTELKGALLSAQTHAVTNREVATVYVGSAAPANAVASSSWVPAAHVSLKGTAFAVYFNPKGYPQISLSDSTYAGVIGIKVCENENKANARSRTITINRIGHISEGRIVEGCS